MIDHYMTELMKSEGLKPFTILEEFCEQCGDLTPHHIEEESASSNEESRTPNKFQVAPISVKECIICRGDEETSIDGFDL